MNPAQPERSLIASFSGSATADDLQRCMALSEEACAQVQAAASDAYAIQLAVEEVCTNIVNHGYANQATGPMEIEFWLLDDGAQRSLQIVIYDQAPPFDPESSPEPDLDASIEDRQIGGLGWFLIKNLMDEFDYQAGTARGNCLRLLKHLEPRSEAASPT